MPSVENFRYPSMDKEWVECHALDISLHKEEGPLNETSRDLKRKAIIEALEKEDPDTVAEYARSSDGLVDNKLRRAVWPVFLGSARPFYEEALLSDLSTNDLPQHKDESQILLDIRRLFTVLSHFNSLGSSNVNSSYTTIFSQDDIDRLRKRLFSLIARVLRKNPCLNYYQGYHDIASVILLVCNDGCSSNDDTLAYQLLESLSLYHLRDFMIPDIGLSINHLKIIPLIAEHSDPLLFSLMCHSNNSFIMSNGSYYDYKFYPALLSILTIYSHDILNFCQLVTVWDFVFSYKSIAASLYIYVSAMQHFKPSILASLKIDNESLLDPSHLKHIEPDQIHSLLSPSKLLSSITDDDLTAILKNARSLIQKYPLAELDDTSSTVGSWFGHYNKSSVLLTTSTLPPTEGTPILDEMSVEELIQQQETEQQAETIHDTEIFQKILEEDSLATSLTTVDDDNSALSNLISSSISSLAAASSSMNHKISHGSTMLLKLFTGYDDDPDKDSKKASSVLLLNFFRVGLTVGFIGLLMHQLLKHTDLNLKDYISDSIRPLLHALHLPDIFHSANKVISSVVEEIGEKAVHTMSFVRDNDAMNTGLDVTQIGLGTVRNSIYTGR